MSLKARILTSTVILLLASFLGTGLTSGRPNEATNVKFYIQVYDVDLNALTAQINASITLGNLNTTGLESAEPVFAIVTDGFDTMRVNCSKDIDGDYAGSSGIISWDLGGELGKGQYFPFEKYELRFQLANVLPLLPNMTLIAGSEDSHAYFEGDKKVILSQTFRSTPTDAGPAIETSSPSNSPSATVYLSRNENTNILWLLIAPTLACFFALASTILVYKKQDMSNRLLVYISLLVFGPVFLMTMQSYFPFRTSLAIPEVLIENLIISTAIFSSLTFLRTKNSLQELVRDALILFVSLLSCSYVLNHFEPQFPVAALPVFLLGLSPFVVIGLILIYRTWIARVELGLASLHSQVAYLGAVILGAGFSFAAFFLGGYLALFEYTLNINVIISLSVGMIGFILFAWSGAMSRIRTRQFNDGVV